MERASSLVGLLIVAALLALGTLYMAQNRQPALQVALPMPSPTESAAPQADWQAALEAQLAAGTPLPTPETRVTAYAPPTLPPAVGATIVAPQEIAFTPWPTATPRPTDFPDEAGGPTPYPSPTGFEAVEVPEDDLGYQPPPEAVPLGAHADDHFWFVRPVDASANSESLFYYPFGSDGPQDEWRVHHGVDMPNPIGEPIRAGGAGTVVFAGDGGTLPKPADMDIYPAYGLVVVIEHDFGYRGQKLYTLYAHMATVLVETGQHVEAGEVIGLSGGTGDVSGPHVHMEVRLGENRYFAVVNPLLWIAPYQGRGVVAGRVLGYTGDYLDDVVVTLSRRGRVYETTTTYIQPKKSPDQRAGWQVVPDPAWGENFVLGDVPEGEYMISVRIGGQRVSKRIQVAAGTVNFVVLSWDEPVQGADEDDVPTG